MEMVYFPQGSIDWIINRLFRLTASEAKANITSTGALSKSEAAMKSIDKLIAGIDLANDIAERADELNQMDDYDRELEKFMRHYTGDKFKGNIHTMRGNDVEPETIALLSDRIGTQIEDTGMVLMGDDASTSVASCSPDGVVMDGGKMVAGAEVKAPCLFNYYNMVMADKMPDDYKLQVHFSMAVCEVDVWHFGALFPGKPLFHKKIERDNFTDKVEESLHKFDQLYRERYQELNEKLEKLESSN